jgi:hypothetical protein
VFDSLLGYFCFDVFDTDSEDLLKLVPLVDVLATHGLDHPERLLFTVYEAF